MCYNGLSRSELCGLVVLWSNKRDGSTEEEKSIRDFLKVGSLISERRKEWETKSQTRRKPKRVKNSFFYRDHEIAPGF
jgi:hypothetical protein